ncbi:DUF1317 family protein, partial [Staphylococcus aureus]
ICADWSPVPFSLYLCVMTHAHDDIRVGTLRLPWLKEKNGWLLPWGDVVTNPLKAQRLAEELNEKQVAA